MTILKTISYIVLFCFTLLYFLPKQSLYFLAEYELNKYDVIISDEKFKSNIDGIELEDAIIYIKGVNIAKLDKVNISLFGIDVSSKSIGEAYTSLDIDNRSLVVNFEPTKTFINKYKIVLKYFEKQKDGTFKYEYKLF